MHHPRIRVAAYVIRYRTTPELLVFDHAAHPEAGTQIPAGGVHSGESLEQAVLREVAEETGLRDVSVVEQLAVDDRPHSLTNHPAEQPSTSSTPNPTQPTPGSTKSTAKEPTTASHSPAASCHCRWKNRWRTTRIAGCH
ncbi:NUDIX domain-containing protein [Nocardia cyriacigeorgica]|uniref:NUDIX domain-containing protein n=1 Tax=Nocardia cyriacigeorgica TaxID=135487 RepID=UPI0024584BFA|nr:NUDIX domain-containing protein [Nocardia cyriacigeorgica]